MNKKDIELKILRSVYNIKLFKRIESTEKPDFICHINKNNRIGVEITELFRSESMARAHKIPSYIKNILAEQSYIHKDDKKNLEVKKITFYKKDEKKGKKIDAIINDVPSPQERVNLLQSTIRSKEKKLKNFQKNINHIDLIISDSYKEFYIFNFQDLFKILFYSPLHACIKDSAFREIFIITSLSKEKDIYIPLKANLLLSKILLFEHCCRKHYKNGGNITSENFYDFLFFSLKYYKFNSLIYTKETDTFFFYFGNMRFFYDDKMRKSFHEYSYQVYPTGKKLKNHTSTLKIEKSFIKLLEKAPKEIFACGNLYFKTTKT